MGQGQHHPCGPKRPSGHGTRADAELSQQHLDLLSSSKEQVVGCDSTQSSSAHPSRSPGSTQHQLTPSHLFILWKETFLFLVQWKKSISTRPQFLQELGFASCPGNRECRSQQTMPGPVSLRDWNTREGGSSQRRSPDRQMLCPPGSPPGQCGGQVQGVLPVPQDRAHAGGDGEGLPAPSRGPSWYPGAQTLVLLQGQAKRSAAGMGGSGWGSFASQSTHIPHPKNVPIAPRMQALPGRSSTHEEEGRAGPKGFPRWGFTPSRKDPCRQGVCWEPWETQRGISLWEMGHLRRHGGGVGGGGERERGG